MENKIEMSMWIYDIGGEIKTWTIRTHKYWEEFAVIL